MARRLLILLVLLPLAAVQGAHITDKLLVGLYEKPDGAEEPVSLLPSGTPLEILTHQGDYARVRLGDDRTGWVEARFIRKEKPTKARLLEAQARNSELQRQLGAVQAQLNLFRDAKGAVSSGQAAAFPRPLLLAPQSKKPGPGNNGEPRRVADLERQLEMARLEAARRIEFEQKRAAALVTENRRLRERLEEVSAMLASKPASDPVSKWRPWLLLLLAALLLSFIVGIAFKNYRIYRRYGRHRL